MTTHLETMRALGVTNQELLDAAALLDLKASWEEAEERSDLADLRKQLADARAEYMLVESALVEALDSLAFYANVSGDSARATMDRIFGRCVAFARVQSARPR